MTGSFPFHQRKLFDYDHSIERVDVGRKAFVRAGSFDVVQVLETEEEDEDEDFCRRSAGEKKMRRFWMTVVDPNHQSWKDGMILWQIFDWGYSTD